MKHFFKHTTKKQWGFMGLAGLMLLAGLLLGEGQAKTVSTTPIFDAKSPSEFVHPSTQDEALPKTQTQHKREPNSPPARKLPDKEMGLKTPKEKKKAGLAILFLGVLAEKS